MRRAYGRRAQWAAFWAGIMTYSAMQNASNNNTFWTIASLVVLTVFALSWYGARLIDEDRIS